MSLLSVELLGDIEIANVLHHPVQAENQNFNSYINILHYQPDLQIILCPNMLVFVIFSNGGLRTSRP